MSGKQLIRKYSEDQLKSLLAQYDAQKLTNTEIAEKFGVNRSTISRWRRKFKMQLGVAMPISDEELVAKYNKKHSNIADLASELGVSKDSIRTHLKLGGIQNPRKSDPKKMSRNVLMHHYTEDQLKQILKKYVDEGVTQVEMAKRLGSSTRTLSRWMKKFNLAKPKPETKVTDQQLCDEYKDGHSASFIATKYDVSIDFVIRRLKKYKLFKGKTYGMKTARRKMHDSLWDHIQKDLDRGARKNEIIRKYHISEPSLNKLLVRKQYLLGINRRYYDELSDINSLVENKHYGTSELKIHATYVLTQIQQFIKEFNFLPTRANLASFSDIDSSILSQWIKRCELQDYFQVDTYRSYFVLKIMACLKKHHIKFELNNRKIILPLEIDIWVPEYNLGFEINPTSMHHTTARTTHRRSVDSGYHQRKSLRCFEKGVRLVHVYEWDDITEGKILDYLQFPKFDFVNKEVDLNKLLITKKQLHKLGYYGCYVSQPIKHYVRIDSRSSLESGQQSGSSVVVYDAGKLILKKYKK